MNDTATAPCVPLVDGSVLARLRDELEPHPWHCDRFIHDYITLMPARMNRLDRAIQNMDLDAAEDAILSLKASSMMVGAALLVRLSSELEARLRGPKPDAVEWNSTALKTNLEKIRDCSHRTVTDLSAEVSS